jgi:uncharacterized protein (TIGR03435 family)
VAFPGLARAADILEFDAASVKPNKDDGVRSSQRNQPGKLSVRNYSVGGFIQMAYRLPAQGLANGPSWIWAEHFDIEAVVDEYRSVSTREAMERNLLRLRTLLEKRFQLRVHRETRMVPSYVLSVAKNGPKFKASKPDSPGLFRLGRGRGHLECGAQEIQILADFLWSEIGIPVVDQTGLKEEYDFVLDFEPERRDVSVESSSKSAGAERASEGSRPSIFTAIRDQLGLRLESKKMPLEQMVIDRVARPSSN